MIIRRIEPQDVGPLLALYHQLNPEDPLPPDEAVRTVWPQLLTDPRVLVFVGEVDGELVTTCTLVVVPRLTRRARPFALVENVVTARDRRRGGLGTAILKHALAYAWEAGCEKVVLLAGPAHDDTIRFCEAAGFQRGVETGLVAFAPRG